MTSPSQTPAGWYPDPSNSVNERYWDGAAWTEQFQPLGSNAATPPAAQSFGAPGGQMGSPMGSAPVGSSYASDPYIQTAQGSFTPYAGQSMQSDSGSPVLGILSIVFGVVCPLVGLVLGIIAVAMSTSSAANKKLGKIGIIVAAVVIVLGIIVDIALLSSTTTTTYYPPQG